MLKKYLKIYKNKLNYFLKTCFYQKNIKYFLNKILIMKKRVVITGYSALTPLGENLNQTFTNIKNRKSNFQKIKDLNLDEKNEYPQELYISSIDDEKYNLNNFSHRFVNTRSSKFARKTFKDCLESSKLTKKYINKNPTKIGISFGALSSNLSFLHPPTSKKNSNSPLKNPFTMINTLNNAIQNTLATDYKIKGPMLTPSTACASSLSAIGDAYNLIKLGYADIFLCGGSEEMLNPLLIKSVNKIGAMAKNKDNFERNKISCPFDKDRHGIVLGEGSGFITLESKESADRRGVGYFCEIVGYGMSCDGFHLVKPDLYGDGGFRSMQMAVLMSGAFQFLEEGNLVLNAHATSTKFGDLGEVRGILKLFEFLGFEGKCEVPVNAFKGNLGHTFSAAGVLETILGVESLRKNLVLPLNRFEESDIEGVERFKLNKAFFESEKEFMLKNSFGFGGVNNSILFRKIN